MNKFLVYFLFLSFLISPQAMEEKKEGRSLYDSIDPRIKNEIQNRLQEFRGGPVRENPVMINGKKHSYGDNYFPGSSHIYALNTLVEEMKSRTPHEPFQLYTFGCGSEGLFEILALYIGLSSTDLPKVHVSMSDHQKSVIQSASQKVFKALQNAQKVGCNIPKISDIYKTSITVLPHIKGSKNYPENSADMIFTYAVATFLLRSDLDMFFTESYKKLKKGGYFILSTLAPGEDPSIIDLYEQNEKKGSENPGHLYIELVSTLDSLSGTVQNKKLMATGQAPLTESSANTEPVHEEVTPLSFTEKNLWKIKTKIVCTYWDLGTLEAIGEKAGFKVQASYYYYDGDEVFELKDKVTRDQRSKGSWFACITLIKP